MDCPICEEISTHQPHQVHYGGQACFSCRAFFRRANQTTKTPQFACKKKGNCKITVKSRRKCQKCRYLKCLKTGMNPHLVLTEDQKKVRFRNIIKKKQGRSKSFTSPEMVLSDSSDDDADPDPDQAPPAHGPVLKYSPEEEAWMVKQFELFDENWTALSLGEDLVKDVVMFSFDVPLSKGFIPAVIQLFRSRSLKIMGMHAEFTSLPGSDQCRLWRSCSIYSVALTLAKLENTKTANEQLLIAMGNDDAEPWLKKIIQDKKLDCILMEDANNITGALAQEELHQYQQLTKSVATALTDKPEMFKMVFLSLLFFDEKKQLNQVCNNYLSLFKRRHHQLYNDNEALSEPDSMAYFRFKTCVDNVKKLSIICNKFIKI